MSEEIISIVRANTFSYTDREKINDAVIKAIDLLNLPIEYFKPGMNVLIKPNLVMHKNGKETEGTDCLYTQAAVVKPVIDFLISRTCGDLHIVVGDAPMQECIFSQIKGYKELIESYHRDGIDIELVDFRELTSVVKNNVHVSTINVRAKGRIVNMGLDSMFADSPEDEIKNMRVTNYDPTIMPKHHHDDVHEYNISQYVLDADLIINMPKPKSHRKAGATISLKNFVGVNTRKEFLPHHTLKSVTEGGDEYEKKSLLHHLRSNLYDKKNYCSFNNQYIQAKALSVLINLCSLGLKFQKCEYTEGSWYGNDTISRTIVDLNKIVKYADKSGLIQLEPQRKMLIVGDMIISGEKEGPVYPSAKNVGLIVAGTNPVEFDKVVIELMGFDKRKLPFMKRALQATKKLPLVVENSELVVVGDYSLDTIPNFRFEPTSGWKNHVEKEE